ncbi:hypothetical protein [Candidatus Solirubrobacter pratensis]|uniref:hypothetical protein n=1 Tax=Candidatus Solirubrobacter pratensis TaxID=1298857 RepID=UPI00041A1CB1|nr:hypothetical protein [Candidatus Solirubrobacter pratensis]
MHLHRIAGRPDGVARPGTAEFDHQRRLLLELAVDPPVGGESVAELASTLDLAAAQVEAAAAGLERAGLLVRRAGRLFAAPAVLAVEALWPLGL